MATHLVNKPTRDSCTILSLLTSCHSRRDFNATVPSFSATVPLFSATVPAEGCHELWVALVMVPPSLRARNRIRFVVKSYSWLHRPRYIFFSPWALSFTLMSPVSATCSALCPLTATWLPQCLGFLPSLQWQDQSCLRWVVLVLLACILTFN